MNLSIAIFVLIFGLCNAALSADDEISLLPVPPCGATIRCSYIEDPVWATDGKSCYVFRNACFLTIENCRRKRDHLDPLKIVPKEKCQTLCNSKCPIKDTPICGYYNGQYIEFPGRCWMDFYICKTGEIFEVNNEGLCKARI